MLGVAGSQSSVSGCGMDSASPGMVPPPRPCPLPTPGEQADTHSGRSRGAGGCREEDRRHGHVWVLVEDVGLGVVLEVAEVPPVGRETLQGQGLSGVGPGWVHLSRASAGTPTQPRAAQPPARPHLQLPHHELLGQVVPPGLPEDGDVAQVVLQTPALGLGRRRIRGLGREPPTSPPSSQGTPTADVPL